MIRNESDIDDVIFEYIDRTQEEMSRLREETSKRMNEIKEKRGGDYNNVSSARD